MGTIYAKCRIENPGDRARSVVVQKLLVDTGSEFTWVPAKSLEKIGIRREKKDVGFVLANGEHITRSVGFAIVRLDRHFTIDEIVFAEPGDLMLLGARTLEGLNLIIDPGRRRLVAAGPLPAASPTTPRPASPIHPPSKSARKRRRSRT
jgi:predicted aspartyl protease